MEKGYKPIAYITGTGGDLVPGEQYFRQMWEDNYPGNRLGRRDFQIDKGFLRNVFTLQNEQLHEYNEPLSEQFQVELKKFYSRGMRRQFRTTILARVLVETAIETGEFINYVDHHEIFRQGREVVYHTRRSIEQYLDELKHKYCVDFHVNEMNDKGFRISILPEGLEKYKRTRLECNPIKIVRQKSVFDVEALENRKRELMLMLLL